MFNFSNGPNFTKIWISAIFRNTVHIAGVNRSLSNGRFPVY